jgi:hypothetical protein
MNFDAREAKLLQPGQHLMVDGCPSVRLPAREKLRTWTYRYKSLVDDKIHWILKIAGNSVAFAVVFAVFKVHGLSPTAPRGVVGHSYLRSQK